MNPTRKSRLTGKYTKARTPDEYGTETYKLAPEPPIPQGPNLMNFLYSGNQVADCIKTNSWKAIYATSDEEFDKIVDEMIARANEYGYDKCIRIQENEVKLKAAAEDAVK